MLSILEEEVSGVIHLHKVSTRDEACDKYAEHLDKQVEDGEISIKELASLKDSKLVCFCSPQRCHGDYLTKKADWAFTKLLEKKRMFYAGIGSRETPNNVLNTMKGIALILSKELDYTLRSGGALGADKAFLDGCNSAKGKKEIFLPWNGYNNLYKNVDTFIGVNEDSLTMAEHIHPRWEACSEGARKLHARNTMIICGNSFTESDLVDFIVCWTKDGKATGGTGQAIRLAEELGVKVFNLFNEDSLKELDKYVHARIAM